MKILRFYIVSSHMRDNKCVMTFSRSRLGYLINRKRSYSQGKISWRRYCVISNKKAISRSNNKPFSLSGC